MVEIKKQSDKVSPEQAVLWTLLASVIVSTALVMLNKVGTYESYLQSLRNERANAVDKFIADCTKDPKSCKFLLNVIEP